MTEHPQAMFEQEEEWESKKHFAAVIPAQAGIQKFGFAVIFKYF